GATYGDSGHGVLTGRPGTLGNDFFRNLLDMGTEWMPTSRAADLFEGRDRTTGEKRWTGTRADLVFASNAVLRALAEVYASEDRRHVRRQWARCTDRAPRHAGQRLLPQPAGHGHRMDAHLQGGRPVRGPGPHHRGEALDRHAGRPGIRLQRGAARTGGGLRLR